MTVDYTDTDDADVATDEMKIVAGVLEVLERTRAGGEVLPEDVVDAIVEEHPPEYTEEDVESVMHVMADAELLVERDGMMRPRFEKPGVEPGECEWCGAPFPEAGRHDVTTYDADGDRQETVHICGNCLSEKY